MSSKETNWTNLGLFRFNKFRLEATPKCLKGLKHCSSLARVLEGELRTTPAVNHARLHSFTAHLLDDCYKVFIKDYVHVLIITSVV